MIRLPVLKDELAFLEKLLPDLETRPDLGHLATRQSREVSALYRLLHLHAFASRQFPYQEEVAAPLLPDPVFSMPCIPSQRTKASNQPVLVVSFGYIPKPWPPCS